MPVGLPSTQQPSLNDQLALGRRLEAERLASEKTREWNTYMARQPNRNTYDCWAAWRNSGGSSLDDQAILRREAQACEAKNAWPLDGPFPQDKTLNTPFSMLLPELEAKDREGFDSFIKVSRSGTGAANIVTGPFTVSQNFGQQGTFEVLGPSDYDVRVLSDIDNEAWNRRDVRGEFQRRIDVEDERRRLEATLLAQAQIEREAQRIVPDSTPALAPPLVDQLREITGGLVPSLNTWAASTGTTLTPQSVLALAPPESLVVVIGGAVGLIVFVGAIYYYRNKPPR